MGNGCSKISTHFISDTHNLRNSPRLHKIIRKDPEGGSIKEICILHPIDTRDNSTEYPFLIHVTSYSRVVIINSTTKFVLVTLDPGGSFIQPPESGRYAILLKEQIAPDDVVVGARAHFLWDKAELPVIPLYVAEIGRQVGEDQYSLPNSRVAVEITDEGILLLGSDPSISWNNI